DPFNVVMTNMNGEPILPIGDAYAGVDDPETPPRASEPRAHLRGPRYSMATRDDEPATRLLSRVVRGITTAARARQRARSGRQLQQLFARRRRLPARRRPPAITFGGGWECENGS